MERTSTLIFWERLPQMWRAEVGWGAEVVNVPQQIYEYPSILWKWVSKDVPTTWILTLCNSPFGHSEALSHLDGAAHEKSVQKWLPAFEGVMTDRRQVSGVRDGADQNRSTQSRVNRGTLSMFYIALLLPHGSTLKPKRMAFHGQFLLLWDWQWRRDSFLEPKRVKHQLLKAPKGLLIIHKALAVSYFCRKRMHHTLRFRLPRSRNSKTPGKPSYLVWW